MQDTTTTEPQTRYYLYPCPDGEERVFDGLGFAYAVMDEAPVDPDARYLAIDPPQDLKTAGREITEEEARRITGYYLEGQRALECALSALERVAPSDNLYLVAQAAEAMLAGLAPDISSPRLDNIFRARAEAVEDAGFRRSLERWRENHQAGDRGEA